MSDPNANTKLQAAMKAHPEAQVHAIPMTDAMRERLSEITGKLVDWLRANTEGPVESAMVLRFTLDVFAEIYDIHEAQAVYRDDTEQSS